MPTITDIFPQVKVTVVSHPDGMQAFREAMLEEVKKSFLSCCMDSPDLVEHFRQKLTPWTKDIPNPFTSLAATIVMDSLLILACANRKPQEIGGILLGAMNTYLEEHIAMNEQLWHRYLPKALEISEREKLPLEKVKFVHLEMPPSIEGEVKEFMNKFSNVQYVTQTGLNKLN